ncbi:AMP-binding protein [Salinispira pacifica]
MNESDLTIGGLLHSHARASHPAILSTSGEALSYAELAVEVQRHVRTLRAAGIRKTDRVAVLIPNGSRAAIIFLAVASCSVCAPINPAFRGDELRRQVSNIGPRELICEGDDAAAEAAALGIPLARLRGRDPANECLFDLTPERSETEPVVGDPAPDDVALLLYTSGTTARPKEVPLTHRNLCVSAANVARSLALGPTDRCLNIMPLFHIHGIVAALLASLHSGGSVVCTSGHNAPLVADWLSSRQATWFTAVPTMLQALLDHLSTDRNTEPARAARTSFGSLRLIRSCSAPLPPSVMKLVERRFGVPVVEAYGMTEAAHQIACNPLPPAHRKPGSVGLAAGPDVSILDESGHELPPGARGEIVVRGPNVTTGYSNNPEANDRAFTRGWFRTGDEGYVDEEGYIFITGRIKEMINRGGEKIAPREIDDVLLDHPAVQQALAFSVPDDRLGEVVGAAVVLKAGVSAAVAELRRHCAQRLALFKIPEVILFLDEIPKGATGKPQRLGLADRLADKIAEARKRRPDAAASSGTASSTTLERISQLWCEVLRTDGVDQDEEFLAAGGDSMLSMLLLSRVNAAFGVDLSAVDFFDAATISGQAELVERTVRIIDRG